MLEFLRAPGMHCLVFLGNLETSVNLLCYTNQSVSCFLWLERFLPLTNALGQEALSLLFAKIIRPLCILGEHCDMCMMQYFLLALNKAR